MTAPEALEVCHYCRMPAAVLEWDHFPMPRRHGGSATVPACVNCHALKDRIALDAWPPGMAEAALAELQSTTALAGVSMWGRWTDEPHALPPEWPSMSPLARVLWGRLLGLRLDLQQFTPIDSSNRTADAVALLGLSLEVPA